VCETHAQERPFVLEVYRGGPEQSMRALVVTDALHCGICQPRPSPVELPELDG
jgi:hypothetical protein